MEKSFQYGETKIEYCIVPNSNLSAKVRIHVHPNGKVEVETPTEQNLIDIETAVRKRARWIVKQSKAVEKLRLFALPREYINGETHFYIGKRYLLTLNITKDAPGSVKLRGGRIEVTSRTKDPAAIKRRLNEWYKLKSEKYFQKRLDYISENISWLEHSPPIKLINMKKQWGSCSPTGVLHLNPWLIRASTDCIDYVITHEICHLKERNHSKKFYQLLSRSYPNWKHVKTKLDGMAELLLTG